MKSSRFSPELNWFAVEPRHSGRVVFPRKLKLFRQMSKKCQLFRGFVFVSCRTETPSAESSTVSQDSTSCATDLQLQQQVLTQQDQLLQEQQVQEAPPKPPPPQPGASRPRPCVPPKPALRRPSAGTAAASSPVSETPSSAHVTRTAGADNLLQVPANFQRSHSQPTEYSHDTPSRGVLRQTHSLQDSSLNGHHRPPLYKQSQSIQDSHLLPNGHSGNQAVHLQPPQLKFPPPPADQGPEHPPLLKQPNSSAQDPDFRGSHHQERKHSYCTQDSQSTHGVHVHPPTFTHAHPARNSHPSANPHSPHSHSTLNPGLYSGKYRNGVGALPPGAPGGKHGVNGSLHPQQSSQSPPGQGGFHQGAGGSHHHHHHHALNTLDRLRPSCRTSKMQQLHISLDQLSLQQQQVIFKVSFCRKLKIPLPRATRGFQVPMKKKQN